MPAAMQRATALLYFAARDAITSLTGFRSLLSPQQSAVSPAPTATPLPMNKPKFITFTGADDQTDIHRMIELSMFYSIEWGILLSRSRQGSHRYPSIDWIKRLLIQTKGAKDVRLSIHLCGSYVDALLGPHSQTSLVPWHGDDYDANTDIDFILNRVQRVQINTSQHAIDTAWLKKWASNWRIEPILQTRDEIEFPKDQNVQWLFDRSGGEGVRPTGYPLDMLPGRIVGFAGGISPSNVSFVVDRLSGRAPSYWIDMESGVRTDDQFDLGKCYAVCKAVFGQPQA